MSIQRGWKLMDNDMNTTFINTQTLHKLQEQLDGLAFHAALLSRKMQRLDDQIAREQDRLLGERTIALIDEANAREREDYDIALNCGLLTDIDLRRCTITGILWPDISEKLVRCGVLDDMPTWDWINADCPDQSCSGNACACIHEHIIEEELNRV
ncbi:MAG: hypothetical protein ABW082_15805 [Sedimenticola sp.]